MKTQKRTLRGGVAVALCLLAAAALAALPLGWFALSDGALFRQSRPLDAPYTSLTPQADDYYLLRMLRAKGESNRAQSLMQAAKEHTLYLYAASNLEAMTQNDAFGPYMLDLLGQLADAGALPDVWYQAAADQGSAEDARFYYSTDSLGFLHLCCYKYLGEDTPQHQLFGLTVENRTGKVAAIWISAPTDTPPADPAVVLPAWVAQEGLDGLGDWSAPTDTLYQNTALWSERGEVLASYASGSYRDSSGQTNNEYAFLSMVLSHYTRADLEAKATLTF